jgi:D-alanine-D-alanine ligase
MGGTSDEREVSLASGIQVTDALREAGHEVVGVDSVRGVLDADEERILREVGVGASPPDRDALDGMPEQDLAAVATHASVGPVDVFFLAFHGGHGEDGTFQDQLDHAGLVYTGSDRLGCALAMDKEVSKALMRDAGVPTPDWLVGPLPAEQVASELGLPVIVKAASGGSSLRLTLAHDRPELDAAVDESTTWNDTVLFERFHAGREFTVGIVGGSALPPGEIVPAHELFDYACKYQPGLAQEIFPADIPDALSEHLQALSILVWDALRLRDYARVDFIVDEGGQPWCLEANALPGLTATSLLPKAAAAGGIDFVELCDRIVRLAQARGGPHP